MNFEIIDYLIMNTIFMCNLFVIVGLMIIVRGLLKWKFKNDI